MDSSTSPRRSSDDSPSGSPTRGSTDRSVISTPSPSRQLDLQSQPLSRVEEYRQLFRLPSDEVLIQDFNCALQDNFLLQGHMYLFVHYICFYSNLFGFETKKVIPFHEITSVRRAKAVAVFPTAIEIIAAGKKYFFTSFLFRDEAFKLINEGWVQHSNGSHENTDQQEPKSGISSQENGSSTVEESDNSRQSIDESDTIESDKNDPILEESRNVGDGEPEIVSTASVVEITQEVTPEATSTLRCSPPENSSAWEPEDTDAPGVHEGYTKVAESRFPIRAEEFFNLFFSDGGVSFQETFHRKCGDKDFKCTPWQPHGKDGHTREVSFLHPIKLYFGAKFGGCQEVQKYRVHRNCHLIIDTSQEISDVPYGDYFRVEGHWDVEEEGNEQRPGCILRVYTNVAFSKKTFLKGKIVQSTVEECREAYAAWIDLAHQVLKQKNLEKEEGGSASNSVPNKQVQLENQEITQLQRVEYQSSDVRTSEIIPEVPIRNLINEIPQPNVSNATSGSLLRDVMTKAFAPFKHQNTSSLLLIISIAVILLLMQMSILVLLSRPQRILVVPPQGDFGHRTSENGREAMALLNKQIMYLKEELHFVETMLDKMQNEHSQLMAKLKDLELFRNQRL
ncbi:Protein VASCULAR ASSOCIATED DEATH 1-chloroplastic [Striga hermonthica]|uniref:Protein VASCULAR ASSOCIATED DEATH 1-chloroplastic n=1 Tax=Striga hermonthica TaxID=68872 RepID=A0A9N7RA58_STRHE|nr:Protein VASCULAR ASSOCIATED DEATH 1-chloroplastic [Striga hermonthica]